jgi:hypothetical protein
VLARSRPLRLLDGAVDIETPVLAPSFSSKAVGPVKVQRLGKSTREERVASLVHSQLLTPRIQDALLVSAYDIKHKLLDGSSAFQKRFRSSPYAQPRLLIIDSGWYEKNVGPAGGQFVHEAGRALEWEEEDFIATIDALDKDVHALVVSWDYDPAGKPGPLRTYSDQISRAQEFFGSRPHVGSTLILKPPGNSAFHRISALSEDDAANLSFFSVVGVTEKELGDTISDRLRALAKLREKLDAFAERRSPLPIHVFGGLDPLYTPLYFAAGAEIFDGLGWLRYAYREGFPYHRDAAPFFDQMVTKPWSQAETTTQLDNLDEIARLTDELKMFAESGGDWTKFRAHQHLEPVFNASRVMSG